MKTLIPILIGLLVVGCGESTEKQGEEESLIGAVYEGDIEAVKKHLAAGADVNFGNPLNIAIESRCENRREIVELLLAKGSDVNAKNDRGWTPAESLKRTAGAMMLVGATDEEIAANNEIAVLLLQHGAKTDADFKHWLVEEVPYGVGEVSAEAKAAAEAKTKAVIEAAIRKAAKKTTGELTQADLEKVTELKFSYNQLTDVKGLEKLTRLKRLVLTGNKLTDVKGLEKLTQLTGLELGYNRLTDVKGLENLTKLKWLVLQDNRLTDVKGLEKLTQLTSLELQNNPPLTKAQIAELQKALPKCRIYNNPTK